MSRRLAPHEHPNNLAYWFPLLKRSGVPVPETRIYITQVDLGPILDGEIPTGFDSFIHKMQQMASEFPTPVFLRTGHFSGKHRWMKTCFVQHLSALPAHVCQLVEESAIVDLFGLPTETWVVREYLDLNHAYRAFKGMPVSREFRLFLKDCQVQCIHPYWPPKALESQFPWSTHFTDHNPHGIFPWLEKANQLTKVERKELDQMGTTVGRAFSGQRHRDWSLDIAQKRDGSWVAIDMALAAMSYHWEDCPHASKPLRLPARERVWMRSPARGHSRAGTRRRYANRKRG